MLGHTYDAAVVADVESRAEAAIDGAANVLSSYVLPRTLSAGYGASAAVGHAPNPRGFCQHTITNHKATTYLLT